MATARPASPDLRAIGTETGSTAARISPPEQARPLRDAASTEPSIAIEPIAAEHWPQVAAIYEAGIVAGNATFEREVPSYERWSAARHGLPCLLARDGASEQVLGWAALAPVSGREVYRGVAAISIYVHPRHMRRGVGRALLRALVEAAEQAGLWTLQAGIFPENVASIALHERCGFRRVGVRERVGQMADGSWRDVLLYERRSETVGLRRP